MAQALQDRIDEAAARILGINRTDLRCLDIVDRRGRVTAGELGREAGLTSGAVTAVLDRLERDGFVRRRQDPDDRRVVVVELTPEARTRANEIYAPLAKQGAAMMERFTDAELAVVHEFLRVGRELSASVADRLSSGVSDAAEFRAIVREQTREVLAAARRARDAGKELKSQAKGMTNEIKVQAKALKAELKAEAKAALRPPRDGRRRSP
jgi:DNA-binding MarR family transcriptional regulator